MKVGTRVMIVRKSGLYVNMLYTGLHGIVDHTDESKVYVKVNLWAHDYIMPFDPRNLEPIQPTKSE